MRIPRILAPLALGGFLVAALGSNARAQSIVNGTFDTFVPSNGTGGGWTSTQIDGAGGHRTTGGNPGSFFILNDNGTTPDPTIAQTITGLLIGQTYTITGDFRTVIIGQNTGATQAFGAAIDGNFLFQSPGITNTNWNSFSFNFTATATSAVLSMAAERNGTDNDFGVDNIAIVVAQGTAAPEPGSLLLVGAGLLLAARVRRRNR